jgi:hypothetical protein
MDSVFGVGAEYPKLYGPSADTCGGSNNTLAEFVRAAEADGAMLDGG